MRIVNGMFLNLSVHSPVKVRMVFKDHFDEVEGFCLQESVCFVSNFFAVSFQEDCDVRPPTFVPVANSWLFKAHELVTGD